MLMDNIKERLARAERALIRAGFEDLGGQEWKPPLGKAPKFIETAPCWIPASERLPEATTDILWKDKFGCVGRCHFTPESRLHPHIIYWIQEPNLPKSEGSDEQARLSWDDLVLLAQENIDLPMATFDVEVCVILYANQRIKALEDAARNR